MTNSLPEKVLLATDGSEDAALASRAAAQIAQKGGAELHVVHAWHDIPSPHAHRYIERELKARGQEILDQQVAAVEKLGPSVTDTHLVEGRTADAILWLADCIGTELLVLGSRGLGPLKRLLVGSVADGVVRNARCPVLVLRGGSVAWPPQRLILADDGSEAARRAGELTAAIGSLFAVEATLLRVYPELPAIDQEGRQSDARTADDELRRQQRLLKTRAWELESLLGRRPRTRIAAGDAAQVIVDSAYTEPAANRSGQDEADERAVLIAVGSRGLGLAGRLRLGSVSTKVLNAAVGPVLVYPAGEEE